MLNTRFIVIIYRWADIDGTRVMRWINDMRIIIDQFVTQFVICAWCVDISYTFVITCISIHRCALVYLIRVLCCINAHRNFRAVWNARYIRYTRYNLCIKMVRWDYMVDTRVMLYQCA